MKKMKSADFRLKLEKLHFKFFPFIISACGVIAALVSLAAFVKLFLGTYDGVLFSGALSIVAFTFAIDCSFKLDRFEQRNFPPSGEAENK